MLIGEKHMIFKNCHPKIRLVSDILDGSFSIHRSFWIGGSKNRLMIGADSKTA